MKKTTLALMCVLVAPMLLVGITASAPYDPWADLDADGDIDIFDVVKIAGMYNTMGDPGKNVNVTNWPFVQNTNVMNWPTTTPVVISGYPWLDGNQGYTIPANDWNPFSIPNTGGYREINVGIDPRYDVDVEVLWHVGGYWYKVDTFHVVGGTDVLKQYSVQGDDFEVDVINNVAMGNLVVVDYYMTA